MPIKQMRNQRGQFAGPRETSDPETRFWAKVDKDGPYGCWLWTGTKIGDYGSFYISGCTEKQNLVQTRAHRYSWELASGPIPKDMVMDHLCHVTLCVNPNHLRLATFSQNSFNRSRHCQSCTCKMPSATKIRHTA